MLERMKFGLVVLNESLREMKPDPLEASVRRQDRFITLQSQTA